MAVSDLYAQIKAAWNRGNSLDTVIPMAAKEAVNLIEMERTYQWMRRSGQSVIHQMDNTNGIAFPNTLVKSFNFIRIIQFGPTAYPGYVPMDPLVGCDPKDVTAIGTGIPVGFWLDGLDHIYLDAVPAIDLTFLLSWKEFTDWPTDTTVTPAILQRAYRLVKTTTMMVMAEDLRDQRSYAMYEKSAEIALNAAHLADEELEFEHQGDMAATYAPA